MSDGKNIIEKLPPQNIEAEQSLLGCLLIDKDSIIKIVDTLSDSDFYKDSHKKIFEAMKELYANHEPIDLLTLTSKLEDKKIIKDIGGRTYLAKLSNFVATSSNIVNYGKIIQKKATLRRLQRAASEIMDLSYNEEEDVDKLLDETEQKIFQVSQKYTKNEFLQLDGLLAEAFDRIDELHKHGGKIRGIPTGFFDLDKILAGLQKTDLIILAARPSVGKTTLALDIARQTAVKTKTGVGIFSLEMGKEQLVDKIICAQGDIGLWKMRTGKLEDNDFAKMNGAMGELSEAPIFIDDAATCSIMDIRAKCRRLQMEKGLGLIIIDYLQLMEGKGRHKDNRVQEVAEISRGLKQIAKELNVPVLALSQLSRAVEQSTPAIPKLAHLRDSGSIEQDADVVMFLYRKATDRSYNVEELPEEERKIAEVYIAKHRNGPTGKSLLYFNEESVSFKNVEKSRDETPPNF